MLGEGSQGKLGKHMGQYLSNNQEECQANEGGCFPLGNRGLLNILHTGRVRWISSVRKISLHRMRSCRGRLEPGMLVGLLQ